MKIGLSFVTLASAAALALSVSAAQARIGESQALAAQMQALKAAALWYPAGVHYFNKQYLTLAEQFQARPTSPAWTARSCSRMFNGSERCIV